MTLYTVKEVAAILRTNPTFVYELIRKKHLPAMKLGQYKIRKDTLDEFIANCEGMDYSNLDSIQPLSA